MPKTARPSRLAKNFAQSLAQIAEQEAASQPIEIWFQDEARIGQKNEITRRWARRGSRPTAPHDRRTASTPACAGAGSISSAPSAPRTARAPPSSAPLQHRRDEPASRRDRDGGGTGGARRAGPLPGRMAHHADPAAAQMPRTQPGRKQLAVHRRQLALQPRLPLLRRHPRSLLLAWNKLVNQPWTIMSIGLRDWAHRF